jgi:hypothetical protein
MSLRRFLAGLAVAACTSACGGIVDPSNNTVENFAGTLQMGGSNSTNYNVSKSGEVIVRINSLTPSPPSGSVGVGLGQTNASGCALLAGYVANAIPGREVNFGLINRGSYCLIVFDPGTLNGPVAYAGTFSHP